MSTLVSPDDRESAHATESGPCLLMASAGEAESRGAILVAALLNERAGGSVVALGVAPPFPHKGSGIVSMKTASVIDGEDRRRTLAELARSLRVVPATKRWTKQAVVGMPVDRIIDAVAAWRASMIVMGLGRHRALDRVFGGETAIAVMRRSPVPVLAVPPATERLPRHALVAADFTSASRAAGELAAQLVETGGVVTVAHVCAFADSTHREGDLVDVYRTGARAKLDETVRALRQTSSVQIESIMLEGEPASALLAYARQAVCDLIAVGGHELGLLDRILLGSVRTQLVRGARCSVLIAPPRAAASDKL
ncbi:MAG: universal stress protein [Gemmatimonadaceae bacterium]